MEGRLPSRKKHKGEYHPAGRLVPVFLASEAQGQSELALSLGRKAASFGETDQTNILRQLPLVRLIWIQLWEVLQLYLYFMIGCLWSRQWAVRRLMSA